MICGLGILIIAKSGCVVCPVQSARAEDEADSGDRDRRGQQHSSQTPASHRRQRNTPTIK